VPTPIRQGWFCWVDDGVIAFPDDRERDPHATRGCVVVEGDASLARGGTRVLVVPTSSQTDRKDTYDVILPHPPAPTECVVLVEHVQPILRADPKGGAGRLPDEWVDKILASLLLALGVEAQPEDEGEESIADADDIQF
jgi:mRNA-degrading endonuclease toxin of MazEF toxin-antitoxin module